MKWIREILPGGNEALFASGLLALYGMEIFFSPDPKWTMWAAQMAMGILYVPDPPTLQAVAHGEAARVLSAAGAFGCLASAAILAFRNRKPCKRLAGTGGGKGR